MKQKEILAELGVSRHVLLKLKDAILTEGDHYFDDGGRIKFTRLGFRKLKDHIESGATVAEDVETVDEPNDDEPRELTYWRSNKNPKLVIAKFKESLVRVIIKPNMSRFFRRGKPFRAIHVEGDLWTTIGVNQIRD